MLERGSRPDVSRSALQQNYQALQEQQPQSLYPDARAQSQNPARLAFVILGALIALGVGIAIILAGD